MSDKRALDPQKIGVIVRCETCGHQKKPRGRSGPMNAYYCEPHHYGDPDGFGCEDYFSKPYPGSLWPGESEADFGYPVNNDGTRQEVSA